MKQMYHPKTLVLPLQGQWGCRWIVTNSKNLPNQRNWISSREPRRWWWCSRCWDRMTGPLQPDQHLSEEEVLWILYNIHFLYKETKYKHIHFMPEKIKAQIGILLLMRKKKDNCYQEFFIFSKLLLFNEKTECTIKWKIEQKQKLAYRMFMMLCIEIWSLS